MSPFILFLLLCLLTKKAHYLCKLLLKVQLLNCVSIYLDMYFTPAVMQAQF